MRSLLILIVGILVATMPTALAAGDAEESAGTANEAQPASTSASTDAGAESTTSGGPEPSGCRPYCFST